MTASYSVRRLTGTLNRELSGTVRRQAFWGQVDAEGAVYDIEATDLLLTEEEIARQLQQRELRSTDLVRFQGCWVSLTDFPPVADEAAAAERHERRKRYAKYAGILFLFACCEALRFALLR